MKQSLIIIFLGTTLIQHTSAQISKSNSFAEQISTVRPTFLPLKDKMKILSNGSAYKNLSISSASSSIKLDVNNLKSADLKTFLVFEGCRVGPGDAQFMPGEFGALMIRIHSDNAGLRLFELNLGIPNTEKPVFTINANGLKTTAEIKVTADEMKNWTSCPTKLVFALDLKANADNDITITADKHQVKFANIEINNVK